MPAKEEAKGEVKVKRSDLTVVAEDTNWRKYCANDLRVANDFNENWGFLTKAAQGKYLRANANVICLKRAKRLQQLWRTESLSRKLLWRTLLANCLTRAANRSVELA